MQKLYHLVDNKGNFCNFLIVCETDCLYPECSDVKKAVVYTEPQMNVAIRYFKRKGIETFPKEIIKEKHERQELSPPIGGLRKRSFERSNVLAGKTETDGGRVAIVGRRTKKKTSKD